MKKLLVDLDEVICINEIVPKLNEFFGTNYTNETFPSLFLEEVYKDEEKVAQFLTQNAHENLYKNPYILPNCKRVLKQLSKYYEINICTAYVWPGRPENTKNEICSKIDFLYKNFDFIDPKRIMFISNKSVLSADVIIDDRIKNLTGNSKIKLLFTTIYNKTVPESELEKLNVTRVNSWEEIKNLLMKIK